MILKRLNVLMLMIFILSACKEEVAFENGPSGDNTEIRLSFGKYQALPDENLLSSAENKLVTVRVYAFTDRDFDCMEYFNVPVHEQELGYFTATMLVKSSQKKRLIAVINEPASSKVYLDGVTTIDALKSQEYLIIDYIDGSTTIKGSGLPMYGDIIANIPNNILQTELSIPVERLVARVDLYMKTTQTNDIKVTPSSRVVLKNSVINGFFYPENIGETMAADISKQLCEDGSQIALNETPEKMVSVYIPERGYIDGKEPLRLKLNNILVDGIAQSYDALNIGLEEYNNTYKIKRNHIYSLTVDVQPKALTIETSIEAWVIIPVVQPMKPDVSNSFIVKPGSEEISIPMDIINLAGRWAGDNILYGDEILKDSLIWVSALGDDGKGVSSTGVISAIRLEGIGMEAKLLVTPGPKEGNALVAVKDDKGNIRWNWHIWVTNYDPNKKEGQNRWISPIGFVISMDRNLGAKEGSIPATNEEAPDRFGLSYEWGRSIPFPNNESFTATKLRSIYDADGTKFFSTALSSGMITVTGAIRVPTTYFYPANEWDINNAVNRDIWRDANGGKMLFDPCPSGWKVPDNRIWESHDFAHHKYGYDSQRLGFYPFTGTLCPRESQGVASGGFAWYWGATHNNNADGGKRMQFMGGIIVNDYWAERSSDLMNVRCVQDN